MEICKSEKCTGCGMCADACPKKCISIKYDEHGFYRSYIDDGLCVNCNHCKNVCPANHPNKNHRIQEAYKARRIDKSAAIQSTSGGIASVLSEHIIRNGGIVVGCGFDDDFRLKHSLTSSLDAMENFKGSKYLQSYTVGIYSQVREQLIKGKNVLFVGTPCQVSALQNYLGKVYDNLYTVDFVCHGVPSQYVLDKYLDSLNQTNAPLSIQYRNKSCGYRNQKACFEMQVIYPDRVIRNTTESGVHFWFASSLSVRESCYNCPYVSMDRAADITLADYKGGDLDDTDDEIGVNTLFINSDKGSVLFEAIKKDILAEERNVNHTAKQFDRLIYCSRKPTCRKSFFDELATCDYSTLAKKYDAEKLLPSKMVRRYYAMIRRIRKILVR